jgi:hypothetical protein
MTSLQRHEIKHSFQNYVAGSGILGGGREKCGGEKKKIKLKAQPNL